MLLTAWLSDFCVVTLTDTLPGFSPTFGSLLIVLAVCALMTEYHIYRPCYQALAASMTRNPPTAGIAWKRSIRGLPTADSGELL
tara:strand:+ start:47 stop:298 length:252 start_codon:yes stop_codon:yes gene_type:complete